MDLTMQYFFIGKLKPGSYKITLRMIAYHRIAHMLIWILHNYYASVWLTSTVFMKAWLKALGMKVLPYVAFLVKAASLHVALTNPNVRYVPKWTVCTIYVLESEEITAFAFHARALVCCIILR